MSKTRIRLTLEQKALLRAHHAKRPDLLRSELCEWARRSFSLSRMLPISTLADLLKQAEQPSRDAIPTTRKAVHVAHAPALEAALAEWVRRCESLKLAIVTGATITYKAKKIRALMLPELDETQAARLAALSFGKGWLYRFQKRYSLKSRRVHGEAASAKTAIVNEGRKCLQIATLAFAKTDIFNMDETAFYYCSVPDKSVTGSTMSGRKSIKKRITVAVTSCADGSAAPPLLFIGSAKQPRCFKGKAASELGLQYTNLKKGWMTGKIFNHWVNQFDKQMREQGRQVLLLLDNVSSHRTDAELTNVTIQMLPPNTTCHLQPQDAGVIHSFKANILDLQAKSAVNRLDGLLALIDAKETNGDKELDGLHVVDILEAMLWAQQAWQCVTSSTIANCWNHTRILDEDLFELADQMRSCSLDK